MVIAMAALPSAAAWGLASPGWLLFSVDHQHITSVRLDIPYTGEEGGFGIHYLDHQGVGVESMPGFFGSQGMTIGADTMGTPRASWSTVFEPAVGGTAGLTLEGGPFTGYIAVWTAGGAWDAEVSVQQDGGAFQFLAKGAGTQFSDGTDMESDAHLMVRAIGSAATVQSGGTRALSVDNPFLGYVGMSFNEPVAEEVFVETSHGRVTCPCYFFDAAGPAALPMGTSMIHRDSIRVETDLPTVLFAGAEIAFPEDLN